MAFYQSDTKCFWKHPFSKSKRRTCELVQRNIQSQCAGLIGRPALYTGCVEFQNSLPGDANYVCDVIGAEQWFDQTGELRCGLKFEDTTKYKISKGRQNLELGVIIGLGLAIVYGIYQLFQK